MQAEVMAWTQRVDAAEGWAEKLAEERGQWMNNALAALKERENSQRTQRSRLNAEVHRLQEQLAAASKTEQVLRAQVQNLETQLALAQHRENERGGTPHRFSRVAGAHSTHCSNTLKP